VKAPPAAAHKCVEVSELAVTRTSPLTSPAARGHSADALRLLEEGVDPWQLACESCRELSAVADT